jgi:hypothetical protein
MIPANMATKLKITCSVVKVESDIPITIGHLLKFLLGYNITNRIRRHGAQRHHGAPAPLYRHRRSLGSIGRHSPSKRRSGFDRGPRAADRIANYGEVRTTLGRTRFARLVA